MGRNYDFTFISIDGWNWCFDWLHLHKHNKEGLLHIGLHKIHKCRFAKDIPLPFDQLYHVYSHFVEDYLWNIFSYYGLNH